MITVNFENVNEAGTNENSNRPPAAAYMCKIVNVEHYESRQGIVVELDICGGAYDRHYSTLNEKFGFWALSSFRSYKPRALPYFKKFIKDVERSNPGYKWDGDETKLIGKEIGAVIGYREYIGNDGTKKTKEYIDAFISEEEYALGEFSVPELKKLENEKGTNEVVDNSFKPVTDDIPF